MLVSRIRCQSSPGHRSELKDESIVLSLDQFNLKNPQVSSTCEHLPVDFLHWNKQALRTSRETRNAHFNLQQGDMMNRIIIGPGIVK